MRKFEKISYEQFKKDFGEFEDAEEMYESLKIPRRKTVNSAGYDFHSPFDFVLHPKEIIKVNNSSFGSKNYQQPAILRFFRRSLQTGSSYQPCR